MTREHDLAAVRLVGRGRVLVATAGVLTASLIAGDRHTDLLYVLGLFWVPWSGFIALNAEHFSPRFIRLAGAAGDFAALFALGALLPDAAVGAGMGCVVVVLLCAYTGGWPEGLAATGVALVVVAAAGALAAPVNRPDLTLILLFGTFLLLLLLIVERATSLQRQAALQSARLLGRSGAILEHVASGVVVTDPTGKVLEANPAAAQIIGCPQADLPGQVCAEALGLAIGERRLDCSLGCALLSLGEEQAQEVWRLMSDGRRRPLLANVSAIRNHDADVDEVVHSLRDITSLKQADEAKTLFLATASHELKTPLTVIRGFGELLLQEGGVPDEVRAEAIGAIVRRAEELANIVDRLLLSSRIEAGRLTIEPGDVELRPILDELAQSLEVATSRPIERRLPDDLPLVVGDAGAVTTVVDHLLDNAVKYSPGGEPVVLAAEIAEAHVEISVTDRGIGMDSEQASHCFEKFWQAESTDVRRFRGSGIGLYIVRSLVEAMGGSVGLHTAPGQGTTFAVVLRRSGAVAGARPKEPGVGEESIVREFMRQIGIPEAARR